MHTTRQMKRSGRPFMISAARLNERACILIECVIHSSTDWLLAGLGALVEALESYELAS
jgi:hypothetical protein